jgi:thioredoxin reductase (NADPH)
VAAPDIFDAIIIGAGPAGLTAAAYLGRFRRRCLVLETGDSRARWIPTSHNIPGFTAGIGGDDLLARLTRQAANVGTQFRRARVTGISRADDAFTVTTMDNDVYPCRCVLLATGTKDHLPDLAGAPEAVLRSLLRFCPICDAYEAIDKRIAVISDGVVGEHEAEFLTTYSDAVTLLHLGERPADVGPNRIGPQRIEAIPIQLSDLSIGEQEVSLRTSGGVRHFDVVYLALGCTAQNSLAQGLRARCDESGPLIVNAHQETSVPRLYAAGDVVRGLNQVIIAAAEGAIAATDIHNKLRGLLGH